MSRSLLVILLVALALHAPMVNSGAFADDYVQRLAMEEPGAFGRMDTWSLFDFGHREDFVDPLTDHSMLPWFVGDDWRVRFLRPLASMEIALQHAWLGDMEVARHLLGLGVLLAVLLAAWRLLLDLGLGSRAALLGLAALAWSDAAVVPIGWAANRSSAWSLLFVILAVRMAKSRRALIAIALAAVATLFKESGLLAFPLVFLRLHGWSGTVHPKRVQWSLVIAALTTGYLAFYGSSGYGTSSAMYAAPWSAPLRFLEHLAVLFSAGVASLFGPFPVDLAGLEPAARLPIVAAGTLVVAVMVRVLWRDVRPHPAAPLLMAWTVIALIPEGGAAPSDRLLWPATFGAAGLLGIALDRRVGRWAELPPRGRASTAGLIAGALVLSPVSALGQGYLHRRIALGLQDIARASDLEGSQVVLLQASNSMTAFAFPATHAWLQPDSPARFQSLQVGRRDLRWTRTGPSSATFESLDGPLLSGPFERLYLTDLEPLPMGWVVHAGGLRFEVLDSKDTGVTRIGLEADRNFDEGDLTFAVERDGRFVSVPAPPVGESIDLRAPQPALPLVP